MRKLYIIGAGGFGAEVEWLIHDVNNPEPRFDVIFVNQLLDNPGYVGNRIYCGLPVIGNSEFLDSLKGPTNDPSVAIAIGDPQIRCRIVSEMLAQDAYFPTLIHPSALYDKRTARVQMGQGTIICAGSILTTNIIIGDFVHINLGCTIGHDAHIRSFCTLSPGVHISGKVVIEEGVFLGTGAVVLPGIRIGHNSTIGAGTVVTKDIPAGVTAVGIPAKIVKRD